MDYNKTKSEKILQAISQSGYSLSELIAALQLSEKELMSKITGSEEFKLSELLLFNKMLGSKTVAKIFFENKVDL